MTTSTTATKRTLVVKGATRLRVTATDGAGNRAKVRVLTLRRAR